MRKECSRSAEKEMSSQKESGEERTFLKEMPVRNVPFVS